MKSKIILNIEGGACVDLISWELELEEGLGRPYRAVVTTASEKVRAPAELRADALGRRAVLTVEQFFENGIVRRYLDGVVTRVRHEGPASLKPEWLASFGSERPKGSLYSFVIEPALVSLRFARRTCDYPNTTPIKTVEAVLARHGITPVIDGAYVEQEKYAGKVRFVQRDETDWDFLHRVLARYGLSYSFAHDAHGPERLYLSDGRSYPAASPLGFENLAGYADGETLAFSCMRQEKGSYPMKRFVADSGVGVDYAKTRFLRPSESRVLEKEGGDAASARQWLLSAAPAGYGVDADDTSLDGDFARAADALGARLRLERDRWSGETVSVAAMPGKTVVLKGYLDATLDADRPLKMRLTATRLAVRLGDEAGENFAASFEAMDFGDDAEKRWVPSLPADVAARAPRVFEAIVCDRGGNWNEKAARNTIAVSPRSTPETPWVFLVANPNGDEGATMDVAMTMPLGGRRQGLYRFPRVGERVLVEDLGDRLVLAGYVPDRTGSPGDFPETGDKWTRSAATLRYSPPDGVRAPDGNYDEVGFSASESAVELVEQRIIDGTCLAYLQMLAVEANDQKAYNAVFTRASGRIAEARRRYFAEPGKASTEEVRALAEDIVRAFRLENDASARGVNLRLRSSGLIVGYGERGIELTTPGELRINASSVYVNGVNQLQLQSEGLVQATVGASAASVNSNGVVARSRRVIDAPGDYDSQVVVGAADGVTATGANVRMNGLFSAEVNDALGAGVTATSGELMMAGAVVDLATLKRSDVTKAFETLSERSGLDSIEKTLRAWKEGRTADGAQRHIADHGVGLRGLTGMSDKGASVPKGNFRGTSSGVGITAGISCSADGEAGATSEYNSTPFRQYGGTDRELTVTQRELLRAKTFASQMDTYRQSLSTVLNTVVDGKSSSVTVRGHQLDLNVQNLNDLTEWKGSDGAAGPGTE